MDRIKHRELLQKVQQELGKPVTCLSFPIASLRAHIASAQSNYVEWSALSGNDELSDLKWVESTLPNLLGMGAAGPSDRRRAQVRMVEVMYDPDRELRGVLDVERNSDVYIALRGLVEIYVQRTQNALSNAGYTSIEMHRRGDRRELKCKDNEARSWTTNPKGADSVGYGGNNVFNALVPIENIAAFRDTAEQEVLVSCESLDQHRKRFRRSIRKEPGFHPFKRIRDWIEELRQY